MCACACSHGMSERLFTGSSSEAGSVLFGTHFERTDVSCDTSKAACKTINGGEFSRNTILLREWDLYYFIANRMSIGIDWLWYDAANLRTGRFSTGANLGLSQCFANQTCKGKGGDWLDMSLNWRYQF